MFKGSRISISSPGVALRRRALAVISATVFAGVSALAPLSSVHAQAWPNKPITLIIPFGAGGATDFLARTYAEKLQQRLGQPVLVDYRPGANTVIASKYVLAQPADGYVFYVAASALGQAPLLTPKEANYDVFKDFTPVSLMAISPLVLVVNPTKVPVTNVKELVAFAKANPNKINVATTGVGATDHLAGELLAYKAGIKMTFVPYKGGAAAVQDVVAGVADMRIDSITTSKPHIESGRLRALAIAGSRTALMPTLPGISDSVPGVNAEGFFMMMAKSGMPQAIVDRMVRETNEILKMPDVVAKLHGAGLDPKPGTSGELGKFLKDDQDTWREVLRVTGIKVE